MRRVRMDCRIKSGNDEKERSRGTSCPSFALSEWRNGEWRMGVGSVTPFAIRHSLFAPLEGSGAPRGASNHAAQHRSALPLIDASGRGARRRQVHAACATHPLAGRGSPSGALLRHSPGRTHPPSAQLQFPRFLRPGLNGRHPLRPLSQVYRAPRRPVVVPVKRWPRAARHQGYSAVLIILLLLTI